MNKAELRKYLEDNARREMAGLRPKFFLGIGSSLKRKARRAEDKVKDVVGDVVDFVDEDILDPAGEFLEEQVLDPAGEFLGEEILDPARKFLSKATPRELQFLAGKLGGLGGGKAAAALAALFTGNPLLLFAAGATGGALGDVAGDYLTTDENEEFEIDKLSAAFSALSGGLAGADAGVGADGSSNAKKFKEVGNTGIRGGDTITQSQLADANLGQTLDGDFFIKDYQNLSAAQLADANALAKSGINVAEGGLSIGEGLANIGRDIVGGAQAYVDPFQGADFNPFSADFGTIDAARTGGGTITDVLSSGGGLKDLGIAAAKSTVLPGAEAVAQMGMQYYEDMQKAEEDYREYLRQRGLRADQIQSQNRTLRRQYYNQSFQNRGYSSEEIAEILLRAKLIDSIEEYDPTDLPEGRKFGEDVTDDTVYAAQGGRIGFRNGTFGNLGAIARTMNTDDLMQDTLGIGDYARKSMMEENLDNFEPMPLPSPTYMGEPVQMPGRPPMTPMPMPGPTYGRPPMAMPDKMTLVEDYMDRLNNMTMGGGRDMGMAKGGIMRSKNAMGTRRTPEGDPISPDVPPGMQMDLRGGGFIPLGTKPRADDVPAMVGKDEFVLNDRAVAGIGKLLTGRPDARAGARALYKLQNEMEASV